MSTSLSESRLLTWSVSTIYVKKQSSHNKENLKAVKSFNTAVRTHHLNGKYPKFLDVLNNIALIIPLKV